MTGGVYHELGDPWMSMWMTRTPDTVPGPAPGFGPEVLTTSINIPQIFPGDLKL